MLKKYGSELYCAMKHFLKVFIFFFALVTLFDVRNAFSIEIRLKEISRINGVRDNTLTGYGLVVGLAGTGDSAKSGAANQSLVNSLSRFDVNLTAQEIRSRNIAAVIVTATLKPFSERGDRIDVAVSSIGDARSLSGGTLLITPLRGVDDKIYALAQGALSVGGFSYDLNGNSVQKNHPTVATIPGGGLIEKSLAPILVDESGHLNILLNQPDFTTARRVELALNREFGAGTATAVHAGKIQLNIGVNENTTDVIARIENVIVNPDHTSRVVVNERTGIVVAGGGVRIDDVTISHGGLRVVISTDYDISQPSPFLNHVGEGIHTAIVPNTEIQALEDDMSSIKLESGATVADLVTALKQIKTSTRDLIVILQAINSAGALHADLIIQ